MKVSACRYLICSIFFSVGSFAIEAQFDTPTPIAPAAPSFVINNRPLIKINGKTISLMDVVKKMDMVIYEHFPELLQSPVRLVQFYTNQWKYTFDDMIFHELTLADGEAKEIKISDGDVREEMERRFGPNIISNLDKLNLEYEEVRKMIQAELLVRQLQGMKVYSKAQMSVTPEVVKREYLAFLEQHPPKEEWTYQVLSVRGKEESICKSVIDRVAEDVRLSSTKLSAICDHLQELQEVKEKTVNVNLSKDFVVDNKNLSPEHLSILSSLKENEFSAPILQTSRIDNTNVYRIFHLKSHQVTLPTPFNKMTDELENKLLNRAAEKEREAYKEKLYKKFGIDEAYLKQIFPDDYQPFVMK